MSINKLDTIEKLAGLDSPMGQFLLGVERRQRDEAITNSYRRGERGHGVAPPAPAIRLDEAFRQAVAQLDLWLADKPYHADGCQIELHQFNPGPIALQYISPPGITRARRANGVYAAASFSVNVIGPVFYLLEIELAGCFKGQGHGSALYERLTQLARDLGCTQIRQTPSGWVYYNEERCETRYEYLQRRGWIGDRQEVYEDL